MVVTLIHRYGGYNPFFVEGAEVRNILFYDEQGVRLETGHGWFNSKSPSGHIDSNNRFGNIDLPGNLVSKHKPNFKLGQPFTIPAPRESYERREKGERKVHLYLPFVESEWTVNHDVQSDYGTAVYYYDRYTHKDGYIIDKNTGTAEKTEVVSYLNDMTGLAKLIGDGSQYKLLDNREKIIAEMKKLVKIYG